MADQSNIAWTKSTFNPWIGCTKVGPGCDGCYAEALDARMQYGGGKHWGVGVPRYRTKEANWEKPLAWNKAAPESEFAGRRGFWPVFCASLADVFDNEVPFMWRVDLWNVIRSTPNLSWLLVTKRIGNVSKMVPWIWMRDGFPPNVRLLITVVNQEEADRDIPKLLALPCKNGVSYEPALGPIDFEAIPRDDPEHPHPPYYDFPDLEWVIVGGESDQSGHKARQFNIEWARSTVRQCYAAGVPVFVKQVGDYCTRSAHEHDRLSVRTRGGGDPADWPVDLRVREFPE